MQLWSVFLRFSYWQQRIFIQNVEIVCSCCTIFKCDIYCKWWIECESDGATKKSRWICVASKSFFIFILLRIKKMTSITQLLIVWKIREYLINFLLKKIEYPNKCWDESTQTAYSVGSHNPKNSCQRIHCYPDFRIKITT